MVSASFEGPNIHRIHQTQQTPADSSTMNRKLLKKNRSIKITKAYAPDEGMPSIFAETFRHEVDCSTFQFKSVQDIQNFISALENLDLKSGKGQATLGVREDNDEEIERILCQYVARAIKHAGQAFVTILEDKKLLADRAKNIEGRAQECCLVVLSRDVHKKFLMQHVHKILHNFLTYTRHNGTGQVLANT